MLCKGKPLSINKNFNSNQFKCTLIMRRDLKILIVDDDADDRKLFVDAIREIDPSIKCTASIDGKHALELLRASGDSLPDFIFLDLRMPRYSGKRCLQEIKNDNLLKSIPVIIYTTSKELEESKELKEMGAVHFISKPTNPEEIYYIISFVLEEQMKQSQ